MLDPGGGAYAPVNAPGVMPDRYVEHLGLSNTGGKSLSGISALGWILAAAAVAMVYQYRPARPYVAGIVLLVILGMLLRSTNTITSQFSKIMKG